MTPWVQSPALKMGGEGEERKEGMRRKGGREGGREGGRKEGKGKERKEGRRKGRKEGREKKERNPVGP
jgi:ribonuclease E